MTGQVTGLAGWAEALVDFYEHCTGVIGIDPQGLGHAARRRRRRGARPPRPWAPRRQKFTEHYELPREFAANGGLMTHDGRWVTGEGA